MHKHRKTLGVTMAEVLVVLVIGAILVVLAAPSFITFLQKSKLKGVGQNAYYNIRYAQSSAIKSNTTTYVSLTTGSSWCYGINPSSACACGTPATCTLGTKKAETTDIALTSGLGASFSFEPLHGGASQAGSMTFTSTSASASVTITVSILGNVTICGTNLPDFTAC